MQKQQRPALALLVIADVGSTYLDPRHAHPSIRFQLSVESRGTRPPVRRPSSAHALGVPERPAG